MKTSRLVLSASVALSLSACSTFQRRSTKAAAEPEKPAAPAAAAAADIGERPDHAAADSIKMKGTAPAKTGNASGGGKDDMKLMLKTADGKLVTASAPKGEPIVNTADEEAAEARAAVARASGGAAVTATAGTQIAAAGKAEEASSGRHIGPVSAEKSLGWLKNGNRRYVKGFLRKDGQSAADRARLATGQKPHAIILSCSDSRVPPEIVFDQKLGEIFVVRTAGENIDPATLASIEYGVKHLGSNLIVVMGHTSCGAVQAALQTMNGEDAGSPWLNGLLAATRLRLQEFKGHAASADLREEVWANVGGVSRDLVQKSEIIRAAVGDGSLKITQAVYDLSHGSVDFKDKE